MNVVGVVAAGGFGVALMLLNVVEKLRDGWEVLRGRRELIGGWRCELLCSGDGAGEAEEECEAALAHAEG
jgi:hypothetical protein